LKKQFKNDLKIFMIKREPIKKPFIQGYPAETVPKILRTLMPNNHFFQTAAQPGVYILYNKVTGQVLVGESGHNISSACSMYLGGQRPNAPAEFLQDLDKHGADSFIQFAVYLGTECLDKETRQGLKDQVLEALNSVRYTSPPKDPCESPVQLIKEVLGAGSLQERFALEYNALDARFYTKQTLQGIYILIHEKTGNFYIGSCKNLQNRMKGHIANIGRVLGKLAVGEEDGETQRYERLATDCQKEGPNIVFALLEALPNADDIALKKAEHRFLLKATETYPARIYNPMTRDLARVDIIQTGPGVLKHTPATKERIRKACLGNPAPKDLREYPVIAEGKFYRNLSEADRAFGLTKRGSRGRCDSENFPDWVYIKSPGNKTFKSTPEIFEKLSQFYFWLDTKCPEPSPTRKICNYNLPGCPPGYGLENIEGNMIF
jgi:GIY-YIG catalytic domain